MIVSSRSSRFGITLLLLVIFLLPLTLLRAEKHPMEVHPAAQPTSISFFGMNTYFTGQERIWNDVDTSQNIDGVATLIAKARQAGVEWTREELSWGVLERHGKGRREWYQFDDRIRQSAETGYGIIGMLLTTPGWAQVSDCSSRIGQYASEGVTTEKYWCPPQNPQDFADYVSAVVERYDGDGHRDATGSPRIAVWQIWNEPNAWETWPGSPSEYGELLKVGYQAVKEADPTALVLVGGLYVFDSHWDDGIGHQDGLAFFDRVLNAHPDAWHAFDLLAIHPFMPDVAPDEPNILSLVTLWGRITTTREWIQTRAAAHRGAEHPLWITEVGWPTCDSSMVAGGWQGEWARYNLPTHNGTSLATACHSESAQATYMVRTHAIAMALGVQHLSYFQFEDKFDGNHPPWGAMSIVRTRKEGYAPKVAYGAYTVMTQMLRGTIFSHLGSLHTYAYQPREQHNPAATYHMRFARPLDDVAVDVLWMSQGTRDVSLPLDPGRVGTLVTRDGVEIPLSESETHARFTITEEPIYLLQRVRGAPTLTPTLPPPTNTPTAVPPTPIHTTPVPTANATPTPTLTPIPTSTPKPTPTTKYFTISPNQAHSIVVTHTLSMGQVQLDIPTQALSSTTTLLYEELRGVSSPLPPTLIATGNLFFRITAYQGTQRLDSFQFARPISLTLTYDVTGLSAEQESQMYLASWEPHTRRWNDASVADATNDRMHVVINHLSEFALVRPFDEVTRIYLPIVRSSTR